MSKFDFRQYPFCVLYFQLPERKMKHSRHCLLYVAGDPVFAGSMPKAGWGKGLGGVGTCRIRREEENKKEILLLADHQFKPSANQKQLLQQLA